MATSLSGNAADYAHAFEQRPALLVEGAIDGPLLESLLGRAAAASFVDDDVKNIGTRQIETPQRIGKVISLLLERPNLLAWLEAATGIGPLRAAAGRLVQTRANSGDGLAWHDDGGDEKRKLGVVVNLSDRSFDGGTFEIRHLGANAPFLAYRHNKPGSIMFFAVRPDIEHRVTPLTAGGPRRVYAGWLLSEPEN